jgi:N12 class adenine-specific DNA methylase
MEITIKKASIKRVLFLAYGYDHFVNSTKFSHNSSSDAPIHDDLKEAFQNLIPHFAFICEEINDNVCRQAINDMKKGVEYDLGMDPLYKYDVTGFTLGKDSEGVTISGNKSLESGKSININTPFVKWDDADYQFMAELIETVDLLKSEVYEYIEGKRAPIKHQTIDMFESADDEENSEGKKHFADAEM